jgi:methylmalonyl-CoA mutase N-terminal domain/subunit
MQIIAAILGGVQSIHSCSYDETIGIPTELSHRTAIRSQQVMMWESGLRDVADPLAGSYYVERLTHQVEQKAWEIFNELEKRGGYMKGLEDGWIKKTIDDEAYRRKRMIKKGELPIVGVNKYVMDEKEEHQPFRVDYEIEKKAIDRLKAFKKKRNQPEVEKALGNLRTACFELKNGRGELMPVLVEAAKKGVTNGEMMVPMREAFGWDVTE